MKRILFFLVLVITSTLSISTVHAMPAAQCSTLNCVRKNIDTINLKIVNLLGERLAYVKRAGELKKNRCSVRDKKREAVILNTVKKLAEKAGYPEKIAVAVFKTILKESVEYEKQFHSEHPATELRCTRHS